MSAVSRRAFLDRECANDPVMRRTTESLLAAVCDDDDNFMDVIGPAISTAPSTLRNGQRLGPYEIEREIGRGGMGAVFLARRADDRYEGSVAIKLLLGLRSEEDVKRFRNERQILADLQHPNIARLLDAGSREDGAPYVVMEYVEGTRITDYCDRQKLNVDERIDLFTHVCAAVQHAHQNLVVHRDLKPDNILVDASGTPKLLDFGIAKLLESSNPLNTRSGFRAMTPAYSSPEQVDGKPITIVTDVYGLGLVLYQLLTGQLPYDVLGKPLKDTLVTVLEEAPATPSSVVGADTSESALPGISQRQLTKKLRGDLDNILLAALQKEPDRRYASVERFADDLRRYRQTLPVAARADSTTYRLRKFIQRHRITFWTTIIILLMVLSFMIVLIYQAQMLARQRDEATDARTDAVEVSRFLVSLFELSDPDKSQGGDVSVRTFLDQGADRIGRDLAMQPANQANMMEVMGQIYGKLGLFDEAEKMLTDALTIRQRTFGEHHVAVASSLHSLGSLRWNQGMHDEARPLLSTALKLRRALLPANDARTADTLRSAAGLRSDSGQYEEANELYWEALNIRRSLHAHDHLDVAIAEIDLGGSLRRSGDHDNAERLLRSGLKRLRKLRGDHHSDVAYTLNQLARLLVLKGDPTAAEPLARESVSIRQRVLGDQHVDVAPGLGTLASALIEKGDFEEAIMVRKASMEIYRAHFGTRHRRFAATLYSLGETQRRAGLLNAAEKNIRQALLLLRELLEPGHPRLGYPLTGLGKVLLAKQQYTEAEVLLREAVSVREQGLGPDHWLFSVSQAALGSSRIGLGHYDEAERLLVQSHENLRKQFGPSDPRTRDAHEALERLRSVASESVRR